MKKKEKLWRKKYKHCRKETKIMEKSPLKDLLKHLQEFLKKQTTTRKHERTLKNKQVGNDNVVVISVAAEICAYQMIEHIAFDDDPLQWWKSQQDSFQFLIW